jgi:phage baseplate assembly protein gpV
MSGLGSFNFSVAANGTTSPRTGTMTVGGQTVTVDQAAGSCTYSVSPTSVSAPSTGLNSSIAVTTGSSCAWTPASTVAWITITSGGMSGLGSFNFSVAANATTSPRTGTMTVGGQTVTVDQAAGSCTYSVSPTSVSAPSTGLNSSIAVTTGSSCAWTPASTVAWITITSGGMSGLGSFNFSVAANATTSPRTGTMTVGGQTVTVNQAAGSCTYTVTPTTVSAPSTGLNGPISVTTGSSCAWTATSSVAWITVTSGMSGSGVANYSVAANGGSSARTGTLTVAGQTVTVNQSAPTPPAPSTPPAPPAGLRIVIIH